MTGVFVLPSIGLQQKSTFIQVFIFGTASSIALFLHGLAIGIMDFIFSAFFVDLTDFSLVLQMSTVNLHWNLLYHFLWEI